MSSTLPSLEGTKAALTTAIRDLFIKEAELKELESALKEAPVSSKDEELRYKVELARIEFSEVAKVIDRFVEEMKMLLPKGTDIEPIIEKIVKKVKRKNNRSANIASKAAIIATEVKRAENNFERGRRAVPINAPPPPPPGYYISNAELAVLSPSGSSFIPRKGRTVPTAEFTALAASLAAPPVSLTANEGGGRRMRKTKRGKKRMTRMR